MNMSMPFDLPASVEASKRAYILMWNSQPPTWVVELQLLREGLERLHRQQQENTEKLRANFEERLAALTTEQQVHLVENLDTLHTAVKQGAQKVTLDGAQLQQIKALLTQESAETRKAVVLHKDLLEEVGKQQKVLETMQTEAWRRFEKCYKINKQATNRSARKSTSSPTS